MGEFGSLLISLSLTLVILTLFSNKKIRLLSNPVLVDVISHEPSDHPSSGAIFGLTGIQEILMQVRLDPDSIVSGFRHLDTHW